MFAIDFKGQTNLTAFEIVSAVGMRGFFIPELAGDYDFWTYNVEGMIARGELRPVSPVRKAA
jgi:hypothetical protein